MAVEYEISSDVATIKGVASNTQVASIVKFYTGSITYDDEPTSKYASVTINGKTQRVMLCVAVSGTVNYDDVPCLYSTVSGHRTLNVVAPTESGTPDDVPSLYETVVVDGKTVRALRCVLISATPNYDGVSSTCTFTDNGKTHTAQLVNKIVGGSIEVIVKGTSPLTLPDAIADSLSYVKAFGGTEQRNIPDGYIERQFIYMMEGSYLLTDIVPTYDGKIEMDFQTTSVPSGSVYLLGGRTETYGGLFFAKSGSDVCIVDAFGTSSGDRYTSSVSLSSNTRYKFTFNNKVVTLESGGTTLFTNTFTGENANGGALVINGLNFGSSTITGGQAGIYLYSFKVWNAQGELVADYVPAIQKGTVPVVGFYDTVSKTFKTATAGTFAAGGEAVPTPDTPMDIVSNNGVLKARHQSGLPFGYTLLDYIESSGTQYIDTGLKADLNTKAELKFAVDVATPSGNISIFGSSADGDNNKAFYIATKAGSKLYAQFDTVSRTVVQDPVYTVGAPTVAVISKSGWYQDGVLSATYNGATDFTTPSNLIIGAVGGRSNTNKFVGKIYYVKIWKNDTLVLDLVPVKYVSGNTTTYGMYDLADTNPATAFHTNAGTGTFTAGNPVSDPVEIYTDGTVETVEITGKNLYNVATKIGGYYISAEGVPTVSSGSYYSALIPVQPNTTYVYSGNSTVGNKRLHAYNKDGNWIEQIIYTTAENPFAASGTTPANCKYVRISGALADTNVQLEQGSTATDYEPYYDGGTATAEMLLKVGNYQDVQSIIDGVVTRNVGVKVLDGTEDWGVVGGANPYLYSKISNGIIHRSPLLEINTHFPTGVSIALSNNNQSLYIGTRQSEFSALFFRYDSLYPSTAASIPLLKQWLADQYAAGTPVIVLYPLATPTTESVAGQTLQVQAGDNTLEITQASLNGLELEAKYQAAVSLTIQEVQDANLDPNVEVTIN